MSKRDKIFAVVMAVVLVALTSGAVAVASSKPVPKAVITTKCVAYQTRVIESDKTRQFHVMWDETCK